MHAYAKCSHSAEASKCSYPPARLMSLVAASQLSSRDLAQSEKDTHLKNGRTRHIYPVLQTQGLNVGCTSNLFVQLTSNYINMPGGLIPPLGVIASWPPANLVNPEGRGTVTSIIAGVLSPITFFIVFARLWVRFVLQRNAGWDDWLMVAALVCP
jgi:hypothetical protein